LNELVVMGFNDPYRAVEVLGQLRRLEFSWAPDLENAVAVEVDARGRLKLRHSTVLDPAFADSRPAWRALLGAIQPQAASVQPHPSQGSTVESQALNAEASLWRRALMANPNFLRDLGALLQPGGSAILALIGDPEGAVRVLRGYSAIVLRTPLTEAQASKLQTSHSTPSGRSGGT